MSNDGAVRMRINKRAFEQYYSLALKKHGSQRRVAEAVGVTHTLIGQIINQRNKTHVNLTTAVRFEEVFGAPSQIIFMPEVFPVTGKQEARAA
ncbi:helix-turn-helix domain-containing protein [Nesterenkonia suensis]